MSTMTLISGEGFEPEELIECPDVEWPEPEWDAMYKDTEQEVWD